MNPYVLSAEFNGDVSPFEHLCNNVVNTSDGLLTLADAEDSAQDLKVSDDTARGLEKIRWDHPCRVGPGYAMTLLLILTTCTSTCAHASGPCRTSPCGMVPWYRHEKRN